MQNSKESRQFFNNSRVFFENSSPKLKNFAKTQFFGNSIPLHCRPNGQKKAWLILIRPLTWAYLWQDEDGALPVVLSAERKTVQGDLVVAMQDVVTASRKLVQFTPVHCLIIPRILYRDISFWKQKTVETKKAQISLSGGGGNWLTFGLKSWLS